jgi:hypothetical protein
VHDPGRGRVDRVHGDFAREHAGLGRAVPLGGVCGRRGRGRRRERLRVRGRDLHADGANLGRNAACAPLTAAYAGSCAPTDLVYATTPLFADMGCTAPAVRKFNLACYLATTHTVDRQTSDSCGNVSIALSAIGAPLTGSWTLPSGGSCMASAVPSNFTDFGFDAGIPISSLPAVGTTDVGTGRIVTRYLDASTGEAIAPTGWVDSQLGAPCRVVPTASGLRCLPGDYSQRAFSDMSCANPTVFISQPSGCAVPTPPAFVQWIASPGPGTCASTELAQSLKVGAHLTSVTGVYDNEPTCASNSIDPNGLAFFSATLIDPATMPVVTDVTE